jgi:hypothetical protein
MKKLLIVLIGCLCIGCNMLSKKENNDTESSSTIEERDRNSFEFEEFKILQGQLGNIKLGMTIDEAEQQFSGLTKEEDEAMVFGFDGGGPVYLYYQGNDLVFGLIPGLLTDTIIAIIALHEKLITLNGLNPESTVSELIQKYPDLVIEQDGMNNWEFYHDVKHNWYFIFMTNEKTQIGEYPVSGDSSTPKRLTTKADWITIQ